ncbi:MAG: ABC transporter permease, partial [Promethearchaeia archaeon]
IYFLQTISPTTRSIIQQMVDGVINGIVNQNPTEIDLDYEVKSAKGQEVNQLSYSAPGYILYGPMTILSFALIVLTSEKKDGIYKRLSSSEVKNYEIILSNILADTLLVFIQLMIGCVILLLFGWSPVIFSFVDAIIGTILAVFLFSFFLLALAFALAPVFKDPDTAGGGVWVILIPLMMISGIFVPIEFFGDYMQNIAAFLPTRFAVLIFQNLFLKGLPVTDPSTLLNMGLLLIYSAGIFIIGVFSFKKFK